MNRLDKTVSYYNNAKDTQGKDINLFEYLTTPRPDLMPLIQGIRETKDKKARDEQKLKLPAITLSGRFPKYERIQNSILEHSGLIVIDIDQKENEHINDWDLLKTEITKFKFIAYASISASGKGVWGITPILYPKRHKEHYEALKSVFEGIGIKIDSACSDLNRLRFWSYDEKPYFNLEAEVFSELPILKQSKVEYNRLERNNDNLIQVGLDLIRNSVDGEKWCILRKVSFAFGGFIKSGIITEAEANRLLVDAIDNKANVANPKLAYKTINQCLEDGKNK